MRQEPEAIDREPGNFYDGGHPGDEDHPYEPPRPGRDMRIVLDRRIEVDSGKEVFALQRRIAYDDREVGEILVPDRLEDFTSDLTSVPALFTWLVPKSGEHLPAALIHDGLIGDGDPPTYVATRVPAPVITRVEADRIFRDAMADTGTRVLRRWLVWSAVTVATMLDGGGNGWSRGRRWYYRGVAVGTIGLIAVLGVLATLDLFDVSWAPHLPWIDEGGWLVEVAGGLAGAVVFPAVLGWSWGRFRIAGFVVGTLLAVLLPVTLVLASVTVLYLGAERLATRAPVLARGVLGVAGMAALVLFWVSVLG